MNQKPIVSPFVMKPARINSFAHLIALLKVKQAKYSKYTCKVGSSPFVNLIGRDKERFDVDKIVEGFLHQKMLQHFDKYAKRNEKESLSLISKRIKELRKEIDEEAYSIKIGNIKNVSDSLFRNPDWSSFRDWLLMDVWYCLCKRMRPIEFLHHAYLKHIQLFMDLPLQSEMSDDALLSVVPAFVKKRFNCDEYSLECYEDHYLWAELFVLFRLGRITLVKELLSKNEVFFEFMSQRFRSIFYDYLDGRDVPCGFSLSRSEDAFKRFFFELLEKGTNHTFSVINTAEDYLWLRLLSSSLNIKSSTDTNLASIADKFTNPKIRFMACVLAGNYALAIDTLLKGDFTLPAKFFLLREICLEQQLDSDSKDGLLAVNPIFLRFLFNIVCQLPTKEQKVRLVEMLKPYPGYAVVVSKYVINYGLLDILSDANPTGYMEFALDSEISQRVLIELQARGEKQKLLKLCHLLPNDSLGQIIYDAVEDAILCDEKVDHQIVEDYIARIRTRDVERLRELYSFYQFNTSGGIALLRATPLFAAKTNLTKFKFVVEKIFQKAVETVRTERESEMAKHIFKVCGMLELSEECCQRASKDLVNLL